MFLCPQPSKFCYHNVNFFGWLPSNLQLNKDCLRYFVIEQQSYINLIRTFTPSKYTLRPLLSQTYAFDVHVNIWSWCSLISIMICLIKFQWLFSPRTIKQDLIIGSLYYVETVFFTGLIAYLALTFDLVTLP